MYSACSIQGLFCVCTLWPSQWQTTLSCNISYWLNTCTKWPLSIIHMNTMLTSWGYVINGTYPLYNILKSYMYKLRPERNGCHFAEDIFWSNFFNETSMKKFNSNFVICSQVSNDYKSTLVQVMACCLMDWSHYMNQFWPISLTSYGVTMLEWMNTGTTQIQTPQPLELPFRILGPWFEEHFEKLEERSQNFWISMKNYEKKNHIFSINH